MFSINMTSGLAIASVISFASQAIFGLLMLHLFSPSDVGIFSIITQVSFLWTTLALAQSNINFLTNINIIPTEALKNVLSSSLARWLLLLPMAAAAIWIAQPPSFILFMGWAAAMTLLQIGWYLAQPWTLRVGSVSSAALVRAVPPIIAIFTATAVGTLYAQTNANALLAAAAFGYGVGALWLSYPASDRHQKNSVPRSEVLKRHSLQVDDRSASLRLAHTAADALAGTAVLLVWQRAYGTAEASYLAVLLRLFGLFPTVVYAAWPQVLLSRGEEKSKASVWIGLASAACVAFAGALAMTALRAGWLDSSWTGLTDYIFPILIWQSAACLFAAHGHMPFQRGIASSFSWSAICFNLVQLCALLWPLTSISVNAVAHLWLVAGVSSTGLLVLTIWIASRKLK
jgi:hypothetical protein